MENSGTARWTFIVTNQSIEGGECELKSPKARLSKYQSQRFHSKEKRILESEGGGGRK